jgi:hypothetical protein
MRGVSLTAFPGARHNPSMTDPHASRAEIEHSHSPRAIAERLKGGPAVSYLRDWVFGGIDGAVTTFAVVAGVAGAELSTKIVLILGAANLIADGFSMAAGNYSGVKAEKDDYKRLHEMELRHIKLAPEGEREEIRQIFAAKGFAGDDLKRAVEIITESRERWVDGAVVEIGARNLLHRHGGGGLRLRCRGVAEGLGRGVGRARWKHSHEPLRTHVQPWRRGTSLHHGRSRRGDARRRVGDRARRNP